MKRHSLTKIARGKKAWEKTVKIGGKKYDKAIIDAAKYGARGDGVISMADSKLILKAARPTGTNRDSYDAMEKATMAYVRKNFKFTAAADKLLRGSIAKLGAKQATATKAMKAKAAAPAKGAAMKAMKAKAAAPVKGAAMKAMKAKAAAPVKAAAMKAMKAKAAAPAKGK